MKRLHARQGRGVGGLLVTLTAAVSLVGIALAVFRGPLAETSDSLGPLSWMAWPVAGWMVLIRRPGNRIGLLCLGMGAAQGLAFALPSMVLDFDPPAAAWIELTYTIVGVAPWLLIVAVLNTFPTGDYAGRAEAFLGRALIVVGAWAMLGFLIREPLIDTGLHNPQRVLDHLSASMRDEIDPESVRDQWLGAAVGTLQPASVAVWVKGWT